MLSRWLPPWLTGVVTIILMFPNLLLWSGLMTPGILLKFVPVFALQRRGARLCVWSASRWVAVNQRIYRLMHPVADARAHGEARFIGELDPSKSYLLICNHQSWADILILFDSFHRRVPFLRFFLKHALLWVPIIGAVCWGMDFPFMKRHSREAIAKNPDLAREDLETTRRACTVYQQEPVTVVNFAEGTRFNAGKHARTGSPYVRLLKPKAGGLAFTLEAMGEQFAGVIDVTIAYRHTSRNLLWSWLCGEQAGVRLEARLLKVPPASEDPREWLNQLWQRKDARIGQLLSG